MERPLKLLSILCGLLSLVLSGCQNLSSSPASAPVEITAIEGAGGFVVKEGPQLSSALRGVFAEGVEAFESGDPDRAAELFGQVASDASAPAAASLNLGVALEATGQLEEARKALAIAAEKNPRHPAVRNELGRLERRLGNFVEARLQYETALESHPQFHFARKNLAILCDLYLSDLPCALGHYRVYAAAVPEDEAAKIWIADLESRIGQGGQ